MRAARAGCFIVIFYSLYSLLSISQRLALRFTKYCATIPFMADNSIFSLNTPISRQEALALHPMALAFVGDAVQSLYTRTRVTIGSTQKTGALHHEVIKVVKAVSQAAEAEKLLPLFDEDEQDIFRRARNCKVQTSAKHAEMSEYRRASGFEAVLGYLYLTGNTQRLNDFLSACFEDNIKE